MSLFLLCRWARLPTCDVAWRLCALAWNQRRVFFHRRQCHESLEGEFQGNSTIHRTFRDRHGDTALTAGEFGCPCKPSPACPYFPRIKPLLPRGDTRRRTDSRHAAEFTLPD